MDGNSALYSRRIISLYFCNNRPRPSPRHKSRAFMSISGLTHCVPYTTSVRTQEHTSESIFFVAKKMRSSRRHLHVCTYMVVHTHVACCYKKQRSIAWSRPFLPILRPGGFNRRGQTSPQAGWKNASKGKHTAEHLFQSILQCARAFLLPVKKAHVPCTSTLPRVSKKVFSVHVGG